jgi:S1-C subfamily serine protease
VHGVEDGTPAATAGLQRGDLLVAAGGRPLAGFDDLFDALEAADGTLVVTVVRGADEREVPIPLS